MIDQRDKGQAKWKWFKRFTYSMSILDLKTYIMTIKFTKQSEINQIKIQFYFVKVITITCKCIRVRLINIKIYKIIKL